MTVILFYCSMKESAFRRTVLPGYNSVSLKTEISDKTHYTTWFNGVQGQKTTS